MTTFFEVDPEGFRTQNAGRKPEELVRELIQNSFDAEPSSIRVNIERDDGILLTVEDDAPGGVTTLSSLFTLYKSDKSDNPKCRGRMGRGLKEIISVADRTVIVTTTGSMEFVRYSKRNWKRNTLRKNKRSVGTKVEMSFKRWTATDARNIENHLRRFISPLGCEFVVNGTLVERPQVSSTAKIKLPTVYIDDDGVERRKTVECDVECLATEPWLYEMGIPVQEIDFKSGLNIGQRIPMNPKRDTVSDGYLRDLYAQVMDHVSVEEDDFKSGWALRAAESDKLSETTRQRFADAYVGSAMIATNRNDLREAENFHIPTVLTTSLPAPVRELVKEQVNNVRERLDAVKLVACRIISQAEMTDNQRKTVEFIEYISDRMGVGCRVEMLSGRVSFAATFNDRTKEMKLYKDTVGKHFFDNPIGEPVLSLMIHELSHWRSQDHDHVHGAEFSSDAEKIGARLAQAMFENKDEIEKRFR